MNLFQVIGELLGPYSPRITMLFEGRHWRCGLLFSFWPIILMITDIYAYINYRESTMQAGLLSLFLNPIGFTISLPVSGLLYGITSLIPFGIIQLIMSLLGVCFVHYFIGSYMSYITSDKSKYVRKYSIITTFLLVFGPSLIWIINNP